MESSGYTFPNKYMAVLLHALDELMGTNGLHALLNAAGLKEWTSSPPGRDDERAIDFSQVSALTRTLVDFYGVKGSQSLFRPANKQLFDELWASDPRFDFCNEQEFKALDPKSRLEKGVRALSELLNEVSDIGMEVEADDIGVNITLERCPYCWGEMGIPAQCTAFLGLIERATRKFLESADFSIEEEQCLREKADFCSFQIHLSS